MFKLIHELLNVNELRGVTAEIDIAKGINKYPLTLREVWDNAIRKIESK